MIKTSFNGAHKAHSPWHTNITFAGCSGDGISIARARSWHQNEDHVHGISSHTTIFLEFEHEKSDRPCRGQCHCEYHEKQIKLAIQHWTRLLLLKTSRSTGYNEMHIAIKYIDGNVYLSVAMPKQLQQAHYNACTNAKKKYIKKYCKRLWADMKMIIDYFMICWRVSRVFHVTNASAR